jgi:hypothetical protein
MRTALAWLAPFAFGACGGTPSLRDEPPAPPDQNDPDFDVDGVLGWYLVGNQLTPGGDTLSARITAPDGVEVVDAWVAGRPGVRLPREDGAFVLEAALGELEAGTYELLLAADGDDTAFARFELHRSHPLYFLVSTDWDYADPGQTQLDYHQQVHEEHPGVLITHFLAPYTFTDPDVSDQREAAIVDWAKRMRDDHGDELALHIHPYCHFVEYAGLPCNTTESTVYDDDPTGYTIGLWAYDDSFGQLLDAADQLFEEAGWGKPVSFRAGGWTATIETLRALADDGFVADTSANNWARMEEWQGDGTLYDWNMEHWAPIDDTSQPYYPNTLDPLSADDPALSILEVPDNAIMIDYVTVAEMTEIFAANWDGAPLAAPVSYMMGWHPAALFPASSRDRVDGVLDLADDHLASDGRGPVVYARLRDMPLVWQR